MNGTMPDEWCVATAFCVFFCRDRRHEEALKAVLSDGSPPGAITMWAVCSKDADAEGEVCCDNQRIT
jgi:hypothetical protein